MKCNDVTTVDELWEAATVRRAPAPSTEEQRVGMGMLRELARGEPVSIAQLAEALDSSVGAAEAFVRGSALTPFVQLAEGDQIQGFMGLSVTRTPHQFTVNGRTLWTWCAYDSLFLPELLGNTARIESPDPETQQPNHLTVSPVRIEAVEPTGMVASMVRPQTWDVASVARIRQSVCSLTFFHASHTTGERWQAKHPETILLSLDEAFAFGKRSNAHRFAAELARRGRWASPSVT